MRGAAWKRVRVFDGNNHAWQGTVKTLYAQYSVCEGKGDCYVNIWFLFMAHVILLALMGNRAENQKPAAILHHLSSIIST